MFRVHSACHMNMLIPVQAGAAHIEGLVIEIMIRTYGRGTEADLTTRNRKTLNPKTLILKP